MLFSVFGDVQESASSGLMAIMKVYILHTLFNLGEPNSPLILIYQRQTLCRLMEIVNMEKSCLPFDLNKMLLFNVLSN